MRSVSWCGLSSSNRDPKHKYLAGRFLVRDAWLATPAPSARRQFARRGTARRQDARARLAVAWDRARGVRHPRPGADLTGVRAWHADGDSLERHWRLVSAAHAAPERTHDPHGGRLDAWRASRSRRGRGA